MSQFCESKTFIVYFYIRVFYACLLRGLFPVRPFSYVFEGFLLLLGVVIVEYDKCYVIHSYV